MKTPNERLKEARELYFETAREAADALGVKRPTYYGHENGSDGFPVEAAIKYARRFKTTLDWIYAGKGKPPQKSEQLNSLAWHDGLKSAVLAAMEDGAVGEEIVGFVTRVLIGALPDKVEQANPQDPRPNSIVAAVGKRSALPLRKKPKQDSEDTRKAE